MYKQLEESALQEQMGFALGKEGLKKQLGKEYGVDVDEILREMARDSIDQSSFA